MKNKLEIINKYKYFIIIILAGMLLMMIPQKGYNKNTCETDVSFVLEQKIADIIKLTYDIEQCSVILTYDTNGEKVINDTQKSEMSFSSNSPFVTSEKLPYVRGALISAKGINEIDCDEIRSAIATLLGISDSKVTVIYN